MIDLNKDGSISLDEFRTYFKSLGLNDDDFITKLFRQIDIDGDGSLTQQGI